MIPCPAAVHRACHISWQPFLLALLALHRSGQRLVSLALLMNLLQAVRQVHISFSYAIVIMMVSPLLQVPPATAFSIFDPQCTAPSSLTDYVAAPDVRSMLDIVWCLSISGCEFSFPGNHSSERFLCIFRPLVMVCTKLS